VEESFSTHCLNEAVSICHSSPASMQVMVAERTMWYSRASSPKVSLGPNSFPKSLPSMLTEKEPDWMK